MKTSRLLLPLIALLPLTACNEDGTVDGKALEDAAGAVSGEAGDLANQAGEALGDLQGQLGGMFEGLSEQAKGVLGNIDLSEMDVDKLKELLNEKTAELAGLKDQIANFDLSNLTGGLSLDDLKDKVPSLEEAIKFLQDAIAKVGG